MNEDAKYNIERCASWAKQFSNNNSRAFMLIGVQRGGQMVYCADSNISKARLCQALRDLATAIENQGKVIHIS